MVTVTGFNIKPQTQRLDLAIETGDLKIRKVRIEAPAVVRRSDTLTYTEAKYADVADHSINDALRKMPGIEVAKSGEIKYSGKAINKFHIKGLNMLGERSDSRKNPTDLAPPKPVVFCFLRRATPKQKAL